MNMITKLKKRMEHGANLRATRQLDNHILRDIGLPEREKFPTFHIY